MKVASSTPLSVNVHLPYRAEKNVLVLALFVKQSSLSTSGLGNFLGSCVTSTLAAYSV